MSTPPDVQRRPGLPPAMKALLGWGVLLFPPLVLAFRFLGPLGIWDAIFLAVLLEMVPILAVVQVPLVRGEEIDRISAYLGSAGAILVLGWTSLALGEESVGMLSLGLSGLSGPEFVRWSSLGVGAGLALVAGSWVVETLLRIEESDFLKQLIPRTRSEKLLFAGVSFAAGLGEELAYRGYAIPVLAGITGSEWTAAVVSSGVFGLLHAYQGVSGVLRTAVMGFALAAIFISSGSLWPAIVAHTVIDLIGGLVLGPRMIRRESGHR